MHEFKYHQLDKLPSLAWCAVIVENQEVVEVFHGPGVETYEDRFFEGAWDGSYEQGDFNDAVICVGSGGKLEEGEVLFCSPSHTLERLHLIDAKSQVIVSNSLAFVLEQSGSCLDMSYIGHTADLYSIVDGLQKYVKFLPIENDKKVQLFYHCNLKYNSKGQIEELPKATPPPFSNFQDYRQFLSTGLQNIFLNAESPSRKIQYKPLVTISTGYDSPTCAALAKEVGCRQAVTFRKARPSIFPSGKSIEDSGVNIAKILGLELKEVDREDYVNQQGVQVGEFVGCGDLGGELHMASLEDDCRNSVFITGYHGDKVWDLHNRKVTPFIIREDSSGASLYEFRLRVGFIHLPLAFFGSIQHPSIHEISHSQEMQQWVIGRRYYERPIPRRILEEKGVGRELFGQKKLAVGVMLSYSIQDMKSKMDDDSFNSFLTFFSKHRPRLPLTTRMHYQLMYRIFTLQDLCIRLLNKLGVPHPLEKFRLSRHYQSNPCVTSFLLHWGIDFLKARYKT